MESPNPNAKDMETAKKLTAMSWEIVGLKQPQTEFGET